MHVPVSVSCSSDPCVCAVCVKLVFAVENLISSDNLWSPADDDITDCVTLHVNPKTRKYPFFKGFSLDQVAARLCVWVFFNPDVSEPSAERLTSKIQRFVHTSSIIIAYCVQILNVDYQNIDIEPFHRNMPKIHPDYFNLGMIWIIMLTHDVILYRLKHAACCCSSNQCY